MSDPVNVRIALAVGIPLRLAHQTRAQDCPGFPGNPCVIWTADLNESGYARVGIDGTVVLVHRLVYSLVVEPLRGRLTIDHLCRVHACINPTHLEQVTRAVNNSRGESPSAQNARKTHCIRGHALPATMRPDGRGRTSCPVCKSIHAAAHYNRNRAAIRARQKERYRARTAS